MAQNLTPKQERFVAEYLVDLNATQAAVRAGYSRKTAKSAGQRLLTHVDIGQAIKAAQGRLALRVERTAAEVLRDIQAVTCAARKAKDHRAALKGLELEGKHLGLFSERVEHSGAVRMNHEVALTPAVEELIKALKAGA